MSWTTSRAKPWPSSRSASGVGSAPSPRRAVAAACAVCCRLAARPRSPSQTAAVPRLPSGDAPTPRNPGELMNETTPNTPAARQSGGRIASIVAGGIAAVLAVGLIAAGAVVLWGDSKKDDHGYLSTGNQHYAASTYALASDNLDVNLDGAGSIIDRGDLGHVRLAVKSSAGKPVFVGIARTSDVSNFLRSTSYTSLTDVDYSPFRASYHDHGGDRRPALPAQQTFWAASAHGSGTQTVAWDLKDGDWSIVVMNADGSRGVDTR